MLVIFSVFDRIKLLPYFLRYYSSIGGKQFVCGLHNGMESRLYEEIVGFKSDYDLHIRTSVNCETRHYRGKAIVPGMNEIRKEFTTEFKWRWYCIADLDEFHFFRGKTIPDVVRKADHLGYDAVHGTFFDRVASDGSFPEINGSLDETFPLACNLQHFCGIRCDKIVLARKNVAITAGHHDADAKTWYNRAEVHHFKWSSEINEVAKNAYARLSGQSLDWALELMPRLVNIVDNGIDVTNRQLNPRKAAKIGI